LEVGTVGQVLLRMVVVFALALVVVRFMGNRTVGQFSPFDFVLMVGIGDIVGNVAMNRTESLLIGLEALVGILLLQQVLARLSLKSVFLRKWFEGTPVILIQNGAILRENLVKTQFNYDDLRQELHKLGMDFSNLKDIKIARLESCGDFSVVKYPEAEPFTKSDLNAFIQSLQDNPLSLIGSKLSKLEQLSADIQNIAEYVKSQQAMEKNAQSAALQSNEKLH